MNCLKFRKPRWAILLTWVLACGVGAARLSAGPPAPTREEVERLRALSVVEPGVAANGVALTVDTASREETRQFFRAIYMASEDAPIEWTGNTTTGVPGETSAAFKEAVLLRINYHRAMAGVPATVVLNSTFSAKAQQAALMMSANNQLNHSPPPTWTHYTADGREAAEKSNLGLGSNGPRAVTFGYIADPGPGNEIVGHRRWILYPQWLEGGTGDVSASNGFSAANAVWVQDANVFGPRPVTRDTFVAWPSPGYVPYQLVFPRWSLSFRNADFTPATVAMTRNGSNVPVTVEHRGSGTGSAPENTIVWVYDNLGTGTATSHLKPSADTTYTVQVNGVLINGSPQNFEYDVIVFDPDVAGPDFAPATTSGSASPSIGIDNAYSAAIPGFADSFQWRSTQLSPFSMTYGAEGDLQGVIAATTGTYDPRVTDIVGAGGGAYHLAHETAENQYITLPGTLFLPAGGNGEVSFLSRLGFATTNQVARVQASTDDGVSWSDIYTQAGNDGATDASFVSRSASVSALAGQTFLIRFAYTYPGSGSRFNQTTSDVGWLIDNITITNVQSVAVLTTSAILTGNTFSFNPAAEQAYGLQARGVFLMHYPMGWGPVLPVNAVPGTGVPPGQPVNVVGTNTAANGFTASWDAVAGAAGYRLDVSANGAFSSFLPGFENIDVGNVVSFEVGGLAGGTYHFRVRAYNALGSSLSSNVVVITIGGRMKNLSTRGQTLTGDAVMIAGFAVGGTQPKRLLIRAVGPTLADLGVPGALLDPVMTLKRSVGDASEDVAVNDDWGTNANAAQIVATSVDVGAFDLANGSKDAVLLLDLEPGQYTVVGEGAGGTSGVQIVEVYETDEAGRLVNISTRGFVGVGDSIIIPGTVVAGGPKRLLVRAVGPTLADFGVSGLLEDPVIEVFDGANQLIASNDDWGTNANADDIRATMTFGHPDYAGAFELAEGSKDAVLLFEVDSGGFTFQVSGKGATTGVVIVEIYEVL